MIQRVPVATLMLAICLGTGAARADKPSHVSGLPRVKQTLVLPPFVPEHSQVAQGGPKIVEVRIEAVLFDIGCARRVRRGNELDVGFRVAGDDGGI